MQEDHEDIENELGIEVTKDADEEEEERSEAGMEAAMLHDNVGMVSCLCRGVERLLRLLLLHRCRRSRIVHHREQVSISAHVQACSGAYRTRASAIQEGDLPFHACCSAHTAQVVNV